MVRALALRVEDPVLSLAPTGALRTRVVIFKGQE